jgi:hypothetical protein
VTGADGSPLQCPEYSGNSTDWLKAPFTVFLNRAFSKLRFIFDEAAALMVKPRCTARMNRVLSRGA